VNSALLSRSKVFVLESLQEADLVTIMTRALADADRGLGNREVTADDDALVAIARYANGDARIALNMLEMASAGAAAVHITRERLADLIERRSLLYDKGGEEHFNIISALHKSMRNSDPDAAVYWLARMLEAGEDPLYVARRIVRFASEDVGNADPHALSIAIAAKEAVHFMGMPEGNTALAQAAIYMSTAPKSNAVYMAYNEAKADAEQQLAEPVPHHLRNAPTKLMKALEYGKGYRYAHDEAAGVADMQCLPDALKDRTYYRPVDRGFEKRVRERLAEIRDGRRRGPAPSGTSRDAPEE
jgi:putative ATPase